MIARLIQRLNQIKNSPWMPGTRKRISISITICTVLILALIYHKERPSTTPSLTTAQNIPSQQTQTQNNITVAAKPSKATAKKIPWASYSVKAGDSLHSILKKYGLNERQIYHISQLPQMRSMISQLQPGQQIQVQLNPDGQLAQLHYPLSATQILSLKHAPATAQDPSHFIDTLIQIPVRIQTSFTAGTINSSLAAAIKKAGQSPRLTYQFQNIFSWKINFNRMRAHDSFAMLYQKHIAGTKNIGTGPITVAELSMRKKNYFAILYTNGYGRTSYYNLKGRNWQAKFLKAPLKYNHISSSFSLNRWHPILKLWRPHYGTDFAAPYGTPVKAAANGRIVFKRRERGYGRVIAIRHNPTYSTRYAHLSAYSKKIHKWSYVKKGQVIGFVGTSGISTGPHLHFEIRKNGVPKNFQKIKLPAADPIPRRERKKFFQLAQKEINTLEIQLQNSSPDKSKAVLQAGLQIQQRLASLNSKAKKTTQNPSRSVHKTSQSTHKKTIS